MIARKIHEKSSQKPPQILPKSSRNRQKTEKNREKKHDGLRMRKKYEKNAKKCEKVRKMAQKGSQKEHTQNIDSLCVPLPADHISWENEGESFRVCGLPRWGEDPRALRRSVGLRETARGS